MCRSKSQGGRRCNGGASVSAGQAGDTGQRESYEGTPWQGYDEFVKRSEELDRRVLLGGESITDIMREEQLARDRARIEQIAREGW